MSKPLQGLNTSRTASVICKRIGPVELKCVSQAELELPFGGVGIAFLRDAAESAAGWTGIRVIVVRMVEVIVAEVGAIEILVNNAGITRDGTLQKMDRDMWDAVLDTNLGSCYNLCKLTFDNMKSAKFGRIVNIGSVNGQAGQYGQVNYAAAKSGIHGFTKALAQEGARYGINVHAIAPGYVDTEMVRAVPPDVLQKIIGRIPVGRLGKPGDISRGVVFLTDDESDFVTG